MGKRSKLGLVFLVMPAAMGLVALVWAVGSAPSGGHADTVAPNDISSGALACDGKAPGMANPAAVYCEELGYDYRIVDTAEGQQGMCAFPDGRQCNEWAFLQGQCGQDRSYCAKHGYGLKTKTDGMNSLSKVYAVCTRGQQEVGTATDLMGLSDQSTRGTVSVEASVSSSTDESPMVGAPPSFDWRNYGGQNWMTSVKNQGSCGSCWAFSAVGVVEAGYNIASGNPGLDLDLSEEYLVSDCLPGHNCCGGSMGTALSYFRDTGVPDEACLPYVDLGSCTCGATCNTDCTYRSGGSCSDARCLDRCSDWQSRAQTIEGVYQISSSQMKQALVDNGPLSVAMGIGSSYGGYFDGQGVYRCQNDSGMNHGVIIVGYNDSGGYWIIKNSWGSGWNGDGYLKLGYGECAIGNYNLYVDVAAPPLPDQDGDGVPDESDNCPTTYNPTQTDTDADGAGDACDTDDDDDDFDDQQEAYLVTDRLDACPDSISDAAWPLDLNNDTQITTAGDIFSFRNSLGSTPGSPNWWLRLDLNGDGRITVSGDVYFYVGMIGRTCS